MPREASLGVSAQVAASHREMMEALTGTHRMFLGKPDWLSLAVATPNCAMWSFNDPAARLASRVQLTNDGHRGHLEAAGDAFGADIDYAQFAKLHGATVGATGRYSPGECIGAKKVRREGSPDVDHASTSYVERQNVNMRMHMRRFTRLSNAFSTKVENHAQAAAPHMMY